MRIIDLKILTCFFLLLASCDRAQNISDMEDMGNYFDMDFEALAKRYVPLDTIPLSDSIHYFNYDINIDRIKENKITAAQYPNLRVYMLDSLGNVLQKISQAGSALGMLGLTQLALTTIDDNGNIFILTTGSAYRLFMFDKNYNFIKQFNLYKILSNLSVFPINSLKSINITSNIVRIFIGTGSMIYPSSSVGFYENAYSLAEFRIDLEQLEVVDFKKHLPYSDVPEVKQALADRKVWWTVNSPVFDIAMEKTYVAYPFSNTVSVYDKEFNLIDRIIFDKLKVISNVNYFMNIGVIEDTYKRLIVGLRLSNENLIINRIDVQDNFLLIQFHEVLKEDSYYIPTKDEIGTQWDPTERHLHAIIKNLETGEEKFITLPPDFYHIYIIDWDTFYGYHLSKEKEFNALIKFRYE